MSEASLPLQKAIVAALKASSAVAAIVDGKVYDMPPAAPVKPYTSMGPWQVIPDKGQDYHGAETTIQIDAWSSGPGSVEVKGLGAAIVAALDEAELSLDGGQRLVTIDHISTQYLVEPDGSTQHAAITFQARTEPSA